MTHGSLFAGVEGFGLGFQQAGYETIWQVEREPYCIAVLKTRFPNVGRYYDIKDCGIGRKHKLGTVDVVTAGFPCQDLSVAGKRAGLAGARSGLFWEVIRLVGELRPSWLVLENVPGLFSSLSDDEENGIQTLGLRGEWDSLSQTDDFETVLTALGELGIFQSIAWTVLDSQYFGVAQRRRRVFIVCGPRIGSAEQVLFEREGCEGDFTQSGKERPSVAAAISTGVGRSGCSESKGKHVAHALSSNKSGYRFDPDGEDYVLANAVSASAGHHGHSSPRGDGSDNLVAATLNSGGNSGGFRTEPGEHIVSVRLAQTSRNGWGISEDGKTHTLDSTGGDAVCAPANPDRMRDAPGLSEGLDDTRFSLLPEGIDSPRYRALGNAVTVSVAKYLAERIKAVAEKES